MSKNGENLTKNLIMKLQKAHESEVYRVLNNPDLSFIERIRFANGEILWQVGNIQYRWTKGEDWTKYELGAWAPCDPPEFEAMRSLK